MSYQNTLSAEIQSELDALASRGEPWVAEWVAHTICNRHSEALTDAEDADFWRHCGYTETRDQVRRAINKRAGDKTEQDEAQLRLPGYDHLQSYYVVKRDGSEVGLPVHDLTDEELQAKAALYRSMARACYAHADELDRFRRLRDEPALRVAAE